MESVESTRSGSRSNGLSGIAADGRNGGSQRTVERFKHRAGEEDPGAVDLVLDLAKAFERVSLPVLWAWATHFNFLRKILRMLCGYFEHQRRMQFEGCVADPLQTITDISLDVMELLAPTHCVARRVERGDEGVSASEAEGFFVRRAVSWRAARKKKVTMADSVETLGVDMRTGVKNWERKKKREERSARHECLGEEVVKNGSGTSERVGERMQYELRPQKG